MSQGPPVPSYIFRGHASPVHALHFFHDNTFLASGDSAGWIVVWSLPTKRPVAVWKAHEGGVMGLKDWRVSNLISHGRDHKLRIWQLRLDDFDGLGTKLPLDGADAEGSRQPWLTHSLAINALNYCAFSICNDDDDDSEGSVLDAVARDNSSSCQSLLLAAPNGLDAGGIDIFHLPSEHRVCKILSNKEIQTGMVMALEIFHNSATQVLSLASGYESGHVLLSVRKEASEQGWKWITAIVVQAHSQPVLSLEVDLARRHFFSSSADAVIARFNIETCLLDRKIDTKHAGQQDLKVRDDGKILATAGWDKRVRVYSCKTMKELAVLKWHQEGCYAIAFANTVPSTQRLHAETLDSALIKTAVDLLRKQQATKTQSIHWLAAGGKDGKISLWDIY